MAKHIQDKKTGQMHGSIGDGKGKIPTPGANTTVTTRHSGTSAPDYNAQHQRFTATPTNPTPPPTSVTPQRGDEPTAAAQAANIKHAVTPNTLRPKPAAPAAPPATTPAGWRLSTHVIKQAAQKNIDLGAITECVDNPSVSYPSGRYPGQERRIRGPICVVVDPAEKKAITVYLDRVETDLRHDQRNDKDALKYDQRRRTRPTRDT